MIPLRVKKAKGLFASAKGLIGEKKPYPLLLQTRFGIHTFGVLVPLDIVILDRAGIIVQLHSRLLPNRFFFWNPTWCTVLELPHGSITEKRLAIGKRVQLIITN